MERQIIRTKYQPKRFIRGDGGDYSQPSQQHHKQSECVLYWPALTVHLLNGESPARRLART